MKLLVPVVLFLILVLIVGAVFVGRAGRKKVLRQIGQLTAYCRQQGWSKVAPDRQIGARTLLPYQATGSAQLNVQAQFAGVHRGVEFQAAQIARPPSARRTTFQRVGVVYVPRRVPGPRVQIAERGLSSATFLTRRIAVDNGPFDAVCHVSAEDEGFARTVLHPGLTAALAQDARMRGTVVALEQEYVAALQTGPLTPQGLQSMLDLLVDVDSAVPWQSLAPQR